MSDASDYSFNLMDNLEDAYAAGPVNYGSFMCGAAGEDTISFTSASTDPSDTVVFNFDSVINKENKPSTNDNGFWKFSEDQTLKVLEEYLTSTYHSHYTSENSKVQVLDIIEAIGDGVPFCRDNLIKYASRFGKKNGMSKLDALKIMHYGVLLYHFAGFHKNTTNGYETF
jgi:hypothetical protein